MGTGQVCAVHRRVDHVIDSNDVNTHTPIHQTTRPTYKFDRHLDTSPSKFSRLEKGEKRCTMHLKIEGAKD